MHRGGRLSLGLGSAQGSRAEGLPEHRAVPLASLSWGWRAGQMPLACESLAHGSGVRNLTSYFTR